MSSFSKFIRLINEHLVRLTEVTVVFYFGVWLAEERLLSLWNFDALKVKPIFAWVATDHRLRILCHILLAETVEASVNRLLLLLGWFFFKKHFVVLKYRGRPWGQDLGFHWGFVLLLLRLLEDSFDSLDTGFLASCGCLRWGKLICIFGEAVLIMKLLKVFLSKCRHRKTNFLLKRSWSR